ncbi:NAD(P)-binding protein [Testicularia cyperi]|uniref:NAD(P)-binding protein n=1 Tax=Testicularia cyperi TaxID=1882483 RepID=A0A317XPX3_9BASI|nr:NAD(P)-binding protein [Testicularia cyperi]
MSSSAAPLDKFRISNLMDVSGLVAVVTGGGSGLGLYAAHALATNGALVYILGRRKEQLDGVVSSFPSLAGGKPEGEIVAIQADITSKKSLEDARTRIGDDVTKRGKQGVQLLICNAGIGGKFLESYGSVADSSDQKSKDDQFKAIVDELWSFDEEDWNSILRTNVTGNYLAALAFLPLLKAGTSSSYLSQTILISSNAAWAKLPILNPMYNISKTAVSHLSQMLSTMFCDHGLRTNLIEPGLYPSDLTSTEPKDQVTGHANLSHTNGADIPIGRCGIPQEHAAAVLYLANKLNNFANGTTLRVDGGALQKIPSAD